MAQVDLIPQNKRTKEEQKVIATQGGYASGVTRKKKKQVKDLLLTLLATKANKKEISKLKEYYPDLEIKTIEDILNLAVIKHGIKGNIQAYNAIYDRIEGKPQQKQIVEETVEWGKETRESLGKLFSHLKPRVDD